MNDLNYIFNLSLNRTYNYSCGKNKVSSPVIDFYTNKFIDKIDLFIGDVFISSGVCIIDDNNPSFYRIKFFKEPFIFPMHLLKKYEIVFKKNNDIEWGQIYYNPSSYTEFQRFAELHNNFVVVGNPFEDFPNSFYNKLHHYKNLVFEVVNVYGYKLLFILDIESGNEINIEYTKDSSLFL